MKKILPSLLFVLSTSLSAQTFLGQNAHEKVSGAKVLRYTSSPEVPAYMEFGSEKTLSSSEFIRWFKSTFKADATSELRKVKSFKDELGFTHTTYQYYFKSYPVEGAIVRTHEHKGMLKSFNSAVQLLKDQSITISLSEAQALKEATSHVGAKKYRWEDPKSELQLKKIKGDENATYLPKGKLVYWLNSTSRKPVLVYKFDVYAAEPLSRYYIYVNAQTGVVEYKENRIRSCFHHHHDHCDHPDDVVSTSATTANGTATTRYSGTQTITTEFFGASYRLRDNSRGDGVETYNMQNDVDYDDAIDFTDSDNNWNSSAHASAYDAHWGAGATYDYYLSKFNRDSYDNQGSKMVSFVHFDEDFDNAFWDGSSMTYGDGSNTAGGFTPLTSLDVVGHEFTHGVTEYSADLQYLGESGALNESFSDIFGVAIEFYKKPASANFLVGDQIMVGGGALRSLSNPNLYYQPDTYEGDMWDPLEEVHTNSGVGNFWFYLLCQGGSGTNDLNDNYTVAGIGMTKATTIAYRMLTVYLTSTSNYADAREAAITAATDLYGACSAEVQAVTNAWYAVGVGQAFSSAVVASFNATQTSFCSIPANVSFTNTSINAATYSWNFGDGGTSTLREPSHSYAANGTYTVTLSIDGGACGGNDTETKTSYIVVNTSGVCPVNMPSSGSGTTQTACTGVLMDNGGGDDYYSNANGTIVIAPSGASGVTLTFTVFELEEDYDFLSIYDGNSVSSPLIGRYTGDDLPGNGTVVSSGGALTLKFETDDLVNEEGFICNWSCSLPTNPPVVNFIGLPVFSCSGDVSFLDKSTNAPNSWTWNFGDGNTSTQQNPSHTYASSGTYTVSLTACNGIGCGTTVTKTNYVTVDKNSTACNAKDMPSNGTGSVITSCSGTLYDDGGTDDYSAYSSGLQTIKPTGASSVTLVFSAFEFEPGYDYLYIYDGESIASPLIGAFTGDDLPNGGTITSSGAAITLRQTSDGSIQYAGFICDWSCSQPTGEPVVEFSALPQVSCDGVVTFNDLSTQGPTSWQWEFGDGGTSTLQNPEHTYANSGLYTVKLTSCNSFGCGTQLIKTNYVNVAMPCTVVNMGQSGTKYSTLCAGKLRDSGGNSDYQNDTYSVMVISPADATNVLLEFTSFNFEYEYDYLTIYDGPDVFSPIIGEYTGSDLPGPIISTGNSIAIRQTSDEIFVESGFSLNWSCSPVGTVDKKETAASLKVYPNPSQGDIFVEYSLVSSDHVDGGLYNALGEKVVAISSTVTGTFSQKIATTALSKGLYILKLTDQNGKTSSTQVVLE